MQKMQVLWSIFDENYKKRRSSLELRSPSLTFSLHFGERFISILLFFLLAKVLFPLEDLSGLHQVVAWVEKHYMLSACHVLGIVLPLLLGERHGIVHHELIFITL